MPIQKLKFGGLYNDGQDGSLNGRTKQSYKMFMDYDGGLKSYKGIGNVRDLINTIPTNDTTTYSLYRYNSVSGSGLNLINTIALFNAGAIGNLIDTSGGSLKQLAQTTDTDWNAGTKSGVVVVSTGVAAYLNLHFGGGVYDVSGSFITQTLDYGAIPSALGNLTVNLYTSTLDGGCKIEFYAETRTAYSGWGTYTLLGTASGNLSNYTISLSGMTARRYVRIKAIMYSSSTQTISPAIYSINVGGQWVSAIQDLGGVPSSWKIFTASDTSLGQTITYEMDTSSSSIFATSDGYQTLTSGSAPIGTRRQYIRYRVTLNTVDYTQLPYVSLIQLAYGPAGKNMLLSSVKKNSTGVNYIYDITTVGSEADLGGSPTVYYNDPVSTIIGNVIFLTAGDNEAKVWWYDGSTSGLLTTPSAASYQCSHLGRLFTITKDGQLSWSDSGNGKVFQALNTDKVGVNDGDTVCGIWSLHNILYVFKFHHVYAITGNVFNNVDATSTYIINLTDLPGLYSRDSLVIFKGYFYYGSKDFGFVRSDGSSYGVIQEDINSIYYSQTDTFGGFLETDKEIIMAQGRYNPSINELNSYELQPSFAYRELSTATNRYTNYYLVANRYLYQLDYSYTSTNETAVDEYYTDWMDFGDSMSTKRFNRLYFNLEKVGAWNLNIDVFLDFNTTAVKTLTVSLDQAVNVLKYLRTDLGFVGTWMRLRFYCSAVNQYFIINSSYVDVDIADSGRKPVVP